MKKSTMTWIFAAAALTVAAGSASAQTYKVEVPVAFRVHQQLMPPGTYRIDLRTGHEIIQLSNADAHRAIMILGGAKADTPKAWLETGKPMVSFECSEGVCALSRIWNGQDSFAYNYPGLKKLRGETRASVVTLPMTKAD